VRVNHPAKESQQLGSRGFALAHDHVACQPHRVDVRLLFKLDQEVPVGQFLRQQILRIVATWAMSYEI
jgi:hypothetical protein